MAWLLMITFVLLVILNAPASAAEDSATSRFRAGAAIVDTTPQQGVSLDGSISKNGPVLGVNDPLHVRALVLDDGTTQVAVALVDACTIAREVFDDAKAIIANKTDLPANRMLMAATHTHAAPRLMHIGTSKLDDAYHKEVSRKIAQAVIQAQENLAPARLGYASFNKPEFLACRRYLCEPGTVSANPFGETDERVKAVSGRSRHIIKPAGPVDPQFSIISIQHADGSPLAVLGNYSVHYCGGYSRGIVSADYFGHYAAALEEKLKAGSDHPPFVGIMSNGTSGDTGHMRNITGKNYPPFGKMKAFAGILAKDTLRAMESIEYRDDVMLEMRQSEVELKVRKPDEERIAWARALLKKPKKDYPHRWSGIYARHVFRLAEYPEMVSIPLQALRIGDIAIVAIPCEVFAKTGLEIKAKSPLEKTFTIGKANGHGGYLPPPKQHKLGGYTTWPGPSAYLGVQAEPKILAEVLRLLDKVAPEGSKIEN